MESVFPKTRHDHTKCVSDAISAAIDVCRERNTRFTSLRRRVLELIWTNHRPVGAYDILDMINKDEKTRITPMSIYRAIAFLMDNGLIHRIASLNAYVGCKDPKADHMGQFLICIECGRIAEIEEDRISAVLKHGAEWLGFDVISSVIEIEGRCFECRRQGNF